MKNPNLTINLSHIWKRCDESSIQDMANEIKYFIEFKVKEADSIMITPEEKDDLDSILVELEDLDKDYSIDHFDDLWSQIYDWADYNRVNIITRN